MATPIIEQIAAAIKTALDALVTAGSASKAERPLRSGMPSSPQDKHLVLMQGDASEVEDGAIGHKTWMQPFAIDCFVRPSDSSTTPVDTAINTLRADVEKALRDDPTWGGLAIDTIIRDPEGFLAGEGTEGVRVNADVHFRHLEDDPYSQS